MTQALAFQHMREVAQRRQQLEVEHEQARLGLQEKREEVRRLQQVGRRLAGRMGGGLPDPSCSFRTLIQYGLNPWWLRRSGICLQCRRPRFHPWVGKILWRRAWRPSPVSLPGGSRGQRSLGGYSRWNHKDLDTTGS